MGLSLPRTRRAFVVSLDFGRGSKPIHPWPIFAVRGYHPWMSKPTLLVLTVSALIGVALWWALGGTAPSESARGELGVADPSHVSFVERTAATRPEPLGEQSSDAAAEASAEEVVASQERVGLRSAPRWIRVVDGHGQAFDRFYGKVKWLGEEEDLRVGLDGRVVLSRMPLAQERIAAFVRGEDVEQLVFEVQGSKLAGTSVVASGDWRIDGDTIEVRATRLVGLVVQLTGTAGQLLNAKDFRGRFLLDGVAQSWNRSASGRPLGSSSFNRRTEYRATIESKVHGEVHLQVSERSLPCAIELVADGYMPTLIAIPDVVVERNAQVWLGPHKVLPTVPGYKGRLLLGPSTPLASTGFTASGVNSTVFARTDADGRFLIEGLEEESCTVKLQPEVLGHAEDFSFELRRGEPNEVNLQLARFDYHLDSDADGERAYKVGLHTPGAAPRSVWTKGETLTVLVAPGVEHTGFASSTRTGGQMYSAEHSSSGRAAGSWETIDLRLTVAPKASVRLIPMQGDALDFELSSASGAVGQRFHFRDRSSFGDRALSEGADGRIQLNAGLWTVRFHNERLPEGTLYLPAVDELEFVVGADEDLEIQVPMTRAARLELRMDLADAAREALRQEVGWTSTWDPVPETVAEIYRIDPDAGSSDVPLRSVSFQDFKDQRAEIVLQPGKYRVQSTLGPLRATREADGPTLLSELILPDLNETFDLAAGEVRSFVLAQD